MEKRYTISDVYRQTERPETEAEVEMKWALEHSKRYAEKIGDRIKEMAEERYVSTEEERDSACMTIGRYIYDHRHDILEALLNDLSFQRYASFYCENEPLGLPEVEDDWMYDMDEMEDPLDYGDENDSASYPKLPTVSSGPRYGGVTPTPSRDCD